MSEIFLCLSSLKNDFKVLKPNTAQTAGRMYVAGYLASKNKSQILGKRKKEAALDDNFSTSAWLNRLDNGGLSYPQKDFLKDIDRMDELFVEYHKNSTWPRPKP